MCQSRGVMMHVAAGVLVLGILAASPSDARDKQPDPVLELLEAKNPLRHRVRLIEKYAEASFEWKSEFFDRLKEVRSRRAVFELTMEAVGTHPIDMDEFRGDMDAFNPWARLTSRAGLMLRDVFDGNGRLRSEAFDRFESQETLTARHQEMLFFALGRMAKTPRFEAKILELLKRSPDRHLRNTIYLNIFKLQNDAIVRAVPLAKDTNLRALVDGINTGLEHAIRDSDGARRAVLNNALAAVALRDDISAKRFRHVLRTLDLRKQHTVIFRIRRKLDKERTELHKVVDQVLERSH